MRRSVIPAFITVFIFWAVVLWFQGGMPPSLPNKSRLVALAVMAGATFAVMLAIAYISKSIILKRSLEPSGQRMAKATISVVPGAKALPRVEDVKIKRKRWPLVAAWRKGETPDGWPSEHSPSEAHKALFEAILSILMTKPDHPASPEATGHGGCSLVEHSLNVVETGLAVVQRWEMSRKNHALQGRVMPHEAYPLMPILLLAHDLGKQVAFKVSGGEVVQRKPYHDRESARLVAKLDELWALDEEERSDLIMAMAFEHHPQDFPEHGSERARFLMEFLIDADRIASANEDRVAKGNDPVFEADCLLDGSEGAEAERTQSGPDEVEGRAQESSETDDREGSNETASSREGEAAQPRRSVDSGTSSVDNAQSSVHSTQSDSDREAVADYEQLYDWVMDLIVRPGTINGTQKKFRAGFWDGHRLFLNESSIRHRLAEEFYNNPEKAHERAGDGRYFITQPLLAALSHKGVLVQTHDGQTFNAKNSLFRVKSKDPKTGKVLETGAWNSAIVIEWPQEDIPMALATMEPAPKPPFIVAALWPQHALRGKRGAVPPDSAPEAGTAPQPGEEPSETEQARTPPDAPADIPEPPSNAKSEGDITRRDESPAEAEDPFLAVAQLGSKGSSRRKGRKKGGEKNAPSVESAGQEGEGSDPPDESRPPEEEGDAPVFTEDDLYAQYDDSEPSQ